MRGAEYILSLGDSCNITIKMKRICQVEFGPTGVFHCDCREGVRTLLARALRVWLFEGTEYKIRLTTGAGAGTI